MVGPASDVFISYKAEDRKRLTPLVKALEDEGFDVWWDQHIGSGSNWREEIETHLDAAKVVIVVWSKKTVGPEGRFVRDEAGQAQEAGHYLPITVDNVRPPLGFREVQALDLSSWKGNRADPRFQVLADTIRHRLAGKEIGRKALVVGTSPVSRRAIMIGGGAVTAAAAAGVLGWEFLTPRAANAKRLAVLPFKNMSGEREEYFAEGLAEELRGALSRAGLQVIGRNSSEAVADDDTATIVEKLDVAHILTGSVRRSPNQIRISAQLVAGENGVETWAQSYDRAPGDAIKIQTDIAESVASALSIALGQAGRAALTLGGTADSVAHDLILQSRKLTSEASAAEAIRKSIALAGEAISRDPDYADAYVENADALARLAQNYPSSPADAANKLAEADAAARRAIALAPRLGSAYAALANIEGTRLHFTNVLPQIKQALALSPDDPNVLAESAYDLTYLGDATEALRLTDRYIALDPLNARAYDRKARALAVLRRYPQAIEAGRTALQLAPNRFSSRVSIGDSLTLLGQHAAARAEYEKMPADDVFRLTGEAVVAARTGDSASAKRIMARLKQLFGPLAPYQYSQIKVQLGDVAGAFAELENAIEVKDAGLLYLKKDPFLDPIRNDQRYAALLRKLNFPS